TTEKAFTLERDGDLAVLWFDLPGDKVNNFSSHVMKEFAAMVDELSRATDIKRVVVASKKPGIFIAGADINEFTKVVTPEEAKEFVRFGQQAFHRFSKLPQTTVAAIDGVCLGGGCELALSCDYRVMSDSPKATIGLPETKLGIFPAWGGTTKLPRLIGLPAALDMILNGKAVDAKRAKRMNLVDEAVPPSILLDVAKDFAKKSKRRGGTAMKFYVEGNPLARNVIFNQAKKTVMKLTRGNYPEPLKVIEVMKEGMSGGIDRGLQKEVDEVIPLISGDVAQNLVRLFFLMEDAKKDPFTAKAAEVENAGVLGAGVMGGGIAQIIADKTEANVR